MQFLATGYFVQELHDLCKKKYRSNYGNILKDIGGLLERLPSVDAVFQAGDVIAHLEHDDDRKPAKLRVPNSTMRVGTRGGYRLICFALHEEDTVILTSVYPKTGPLGKAMPSVEELKAMLRDYLGAFEEESEGFWAVEVVDGVVGVG